MRINPELKIRTLLQRLTLNGMPSYRAESNVQGWGMWYAMSRVSTIDNTAEVVSDESEWRAVDIGEPWPDTKKQLGQAKLLQLAESLALAEYRRVHGDDSGMHRPKQKGTP